MINANDSYGLESYNVKVSEEYSKKYEASDELHIISEGLSTVPDEMLRLKRLRFLHIRNNLLQNIPEGIKHLKSLVYLDVSHNNLENLPSSLTELIQLRYLNISHNKFTLVPSPLYEGLQFLRILDMSYNFITCCNRPLSCSDVILELNLSCNELQTMPRWIFNNKSLMKNLDLSFNPFGDGEHNFCCQNAVNLFKNLKVLKVQNCNLTDKGLHFILHMTNLEALWICNDDDGKVQPKNYMRTLNSRFFEKCNNLKFLLASNVGISVLPLYFDLFKNILHLDLGNNFLSWLPDSFCELISLKICRLSSNLLSFLPANFGKLINLQEIYLNNNKFFDLPQSFQDIQNLEVIDLYDNNLKSINVKIVNLTHLKGIDLECNYLDFHTLLVRQEEYEQFKKKYSLLKLQYRDKMREKRIDSQIQQASDKEVPENDTFSTSSKNESDDSTNSDIYEDPEFFTENWDEDSNLLSSSEENDFDPNVNCKSRMEIKKRSLRNHFLGNFCPGDNHAVSLKKYFTRSVLQRPDVVIVEGQYNLDY